MLQRIQTVYLGFVFLLAFLFMFLPLGLYGEGHGLRLSAVSAFSEWYPAVTHGSFQILLVFMGLACAALSMYTILIYKKRLLQIRLGQFNILLHLGLLVAAFYYLDHVREQIPGADFSYGAGIFLPLFSLLLILMANRAIKRDENLVRAADRIR